MMGMVIRSFSLVHILPEELSFATLLVPLKTAEAGHLLPGDLIRIDGAEEAERFW
jgi:hypothetical protein